jgi:hypothetical protein
MSFPRASLRFSALSFALVAHLVAARQSFASCGAESCPLDNSAFTGRARHLSLEFSYHYVDQDRVQIGSRSGDLAEAYASGGEVRTVSHISTTKATYSIGSRWLVSASLPVVDRMHRHVTADTPTGPELREWQYSGVGDLTLLGTGSVWKTSSSTSPFTVALQAGVKLPTGRRHIQAIDGEEPEPHARPGTGSTDLLAGLQLIQALPVPASAGTPTVLFASALYDHTGHGVDGYRVGKMLETHVGAAYPLLERLGLLAQVSAQTRDKDHSEVDPDADAHAHVARINHGEEESGIHENTGGTFVYAAPGLRYEISPVLALSAYLQLPIYQRANGTQLVAPSQYWISTTYRLP